MLYPMSARYWTNWKNLNCRRWPIETLGAAMRKRLVKPMKLRRRTDLILLRADVTKMLTEKAYSKLAAHCTLATGQAPSGPNPRNT